MIAPTLCMVVISNKFWEIVDYCATSILSAIIISFVNSGCGVIGLVRILILTHNKHHISKLLYIV